MKRVLWVCGVVACVAAGIAVILWPTPKPAPSPEPVAVHFSDLPKVVYRTGEHRGKLVRIAYPLRLHQTANPLVWEFRPGSDQLPPTHRVHFADPPQFPDRLPVVVVGTVDGIDPDLVMRPGNVPGPVVIRAASVARSSSP